MVALLKEEMAPNEEEDDSDSRMLCSTNKKMVRKTSNGMTMAVNYHDGRLEVFSNNEEAATEKRMMMGGC